MKDFLWMGILNYSGFEETVALILFTQACCGEDVNSVTTILFLKLIMAILVTGFVDLGMS